LNPIFPPASPLAPRVPLPLMGMPFFAATGLGWSVLVAASVVVLWWAWNLTMPQVFNLPRLRFWQAFRLVVIAAVLFGGVHIGLP
jgi:hypothetical protein